MFLYKSKVDLFCLKSFDKIIDKFRQNCVNIAEALSDFRENNKSFRSKLENVEEAIKQF